MPAGVGGYSNACPTVSSRHELGVHCAILGSYWARKLAHTVSGVVESSDFSVHRECALRDADGRAKLGGFGRALHHARGPSSRKTSPPSATSGRLAPHTHHSLAAMDDVTQGTSLTHPYTCLSCSLAFENAQSQRDHYATDLHRYNSKRRVAGLPPVTAQVFSDKIGDRSTPDASAEPAAKHACKACK